MSEDGKMLLIQPKNSIRLIVFTIVLKKNRYLSSYIMSI